MEDDLAKDEIVLKEKKPRSEAQIKAFEKAREIRLENSKIKKEKIAEVKEQVKNRNKVGELKVPPTTPSLPVEVQKKEKVRENVVLSDEEPEVVIVKKKKKPKVIYMEESDEEPEPQIIKKKKDPVVQPVLAKPIQTIRFF
jgi:phosphatidylinositol kinase/protein kinase (PI-3  family)